VTGYVNLEREEGFEGSSGVRVLATFASFFGDVRPNWGVGNDVYSTSEGVVV
jgi:hypothetical protein